MLEAFYDIVMFVAGIGVIAVMVWNLEGEVVSSLYKLSSFKKRCISKDKICLYFVSYVSLNKYFW